MIIDITLVGPKFMTGWLVSCSVVSGSLRPHGLQHARPPCPSPSPGICSKSFSTWKFGHCHFLTLYKFTNFLILPKIVFSTSLQFSHSVKSDSLRPHGLQHARPPCPLLTPGAYSNSCPLSLWCHPTISSSVVPFSCLQSFPASRSFPRSQFFASGCQSIGFSISPSSEYSGLISFRMDWLDLLAVQGTLKSLLQHHSSKASILWCSAFFIVQLSHPFMTTGKPQLWLDGPLLAM